MSKKYLKTNVFSWYLSHNLAEQSELIFGDINKDRFSGEMRYHKVIDKRFFTIALDDILVDGKSTGFCKNAKPKCKAAPDSGSTAFGVPEEFKKQIDKIIPEKDCNQD